MPPPATSLREATSDGPPPLPRQGAMHAADVPQLEVDDIRVSYHPGAGRPTAVHRFQDYTVHRQEVNPDSIDSEPWRPFETRADFELAELVHETHLNQGQIDRLLQLIRSVSSGRSDLTFMNHRDVNKAWQDAGLFHPTVCTHVVSR